MGGGDRQENTLHGSGQSVNVSIGFGPMTILCAFLFAIVVILALTVRSASKAEMRATAAETAATNYAAELRQTQFWMMRASSVCAASGVVMPPLPANFARP
jgi:hypothetical protein